MRRLRQGQDLAQWWFLSPNAAGTIAMAHLPSPMALPALGLPIPSWTLNPTGAMVSHLLLCAFPGIVGETSRDAQLRMNFR